MLPTARANHQALSFHLEQCSGIRDKKILILQGQIGSYLEFFKDSTFTALTYDAGHHQGWHRHNIKSVQSIDSDERFDIIIQFGSKSETETRLALGKYSLNLKPGGRYIAAVHNKLGSSRYKKQIGELYKDIASNSKSKSRVFDAIKDESFNQALAEKWSLLETPSCISGTEYQTLPGVYGEKKLDAGSVYLSELIKNEYWSGRGADFGSGYGYLAGQLLSKRNKVQEVHLYELDFRALEMAKLNIQSKCDTLKSLETHWCDFTQAPAPSRPYHWAVMNPPFHEGTSQDFDLGLAFIKQASKMLNSGAPLFMVANVHLPYEDTLYQEFRSVVKLGEEHGFKAFKAIK